MNKEIIEAYWPLDEVAIEAVLQKSGERTVTKVFSKQGVFVFKQASFAKNEDGMERDTAIFEYLEKQNFTAPKLLKTRDGKNFQQLDKQFAYVLSYINGQIPEQNPQNYARLGRLTARLHSLKDYSIETAFDANAVIAEKLEENKRHVIGAEYDALLRQLPDFSKFPKSLIHTDIGTHNAIQKKSGEIVLIDWDDVGIGTRILDIGFPLICGFVNTEFKFELENAKAYYSAYFNDIDITEVEKKHIFDAGLFYILMYSIFDGADDIHEGNWRKARFAIANKELFLSSLY